MPFHLANAYIVWLESRIWNFKNVNYIYHPAIGT